MNDHVIPHLGERDILTIKPKDILVILQGLADEGKFHMMEGVRSIISRIFRYAAANGVDVMDPTVVLQGAIPVPQGRHYPSPKDKAGITRLIRAIDSYPSKMLRVAMLFSAYTFCRPGEVRRAEWCEIDLEASEWRIPADKMKMRRTHIVPLATQVVKLIKELEPLTGRGKYLFPNARTSNGSRPMSDAGVRTAIRSMGSTEEEMVPHGFRSMASTVLYEHGFAGDWIERQLSHIEGNKIKAAYNYAQHLDDRRRMMQWYADYLDGLKNDPANG